jgi:Na+-transporting NADH:ubiquinone oxidoreductase subunit NqrC
MRQSDLTIIKMYLIENDMQELEIKNEDDVSHLFSKTYEQRLKNGTTRDFSKWQSRKVEHLKAKMKSINDKMISLENQLNLQHRSNHDMRRTIESEIARL